MPRKLKDAVVVITGASSGIGRATAHAFARRRARVVVAARREEPLRELVAECEQLGGQALAVPTDVRDPQAVQALARRAVDTFGRIDVWVNNAAVTLFAKFEESPPDVYREVIETNLFGYIHGARAVMPIFRDQGSGVLINNASMMARMAEPYLSAYVASKMAIRGVATSLRQELFLDKAKDIHVSTIMPAAIDTPFFLHGANYTGRAAKAMPPVYPAMSVADAIVRMAQRPRREVFVGNAGRMLQLQHYLAPGLAEKQSARMVDKLHLYQDKPAPPTPGNVFAPMPEGTSVTGGWKADGARPMRRWAVAGLTAGIPAVVLLRRNRTGRISHEGHGKRTGLLGAIGVLRR